MGCSKCKKKKREKPLERPRTRPSRPVPNPPPTPAKAPEKPSEGSKEWRGGAPFGKGDTLDAEVPDEYKDSFEMYEEDPFHEEEISNEVEGEGGECTDCEKVDKEMETNIQRFKFNTVSPYIKALQKERNEAVESIKEINTKIDALKFYLNGLDHEGVDISYLTDPLEEEIKKMAAHWLGNIQSRAPLRD